MWKYVVDDSVKEDMSDWNIWCFDCLKAVQTKSTAHTFHSGHDVDYVRKADKARYAAVGYGNR